MRWGVGEVALERALSPSSASDHLGTAVSSLPCSALPCDAPAHPWELVSPGLEAEGEQWEDEGGFCRASGSCRQCGAGPQGFIPLTIFGERPS